MKTVGTTPPARGELRCERLADDTLLVHLVGHWTIHAGAPVVTEVHAAARRQPPVRRLAFEAQELTAWDSRLLTVLPGAGGEHAPADRRRSAGPAGRRPPPPGAGRRRARARRRPARGAPLSWLAASGPRCSPPGRAPGTCWASLARPSSLGLRLVVGQARFGGSIWLSSCRKRRAGPRHCHPHQLSHWPDPGLYGGVQLRQFGAQIFVADLVGRG